MLIHQMHLLAGTDPVLAASILKSVGKAVFWIFAVVFLAGGLIGLLIGFFAGRAVGRKQHAPAAAPSDADQLSG